MRIILVAGDFSAVPDRINYLALCPPIDCAEGCHGTTGLDNWHGLLHEKGATMCDIFNFDGLDILYDGNDTWIRIYEKEKITPEMYAVICKCQNIFQIISTFRDYGGFAMSASPETLWELYESDCPIVTDEMREEAKQGLMGYPQVKYVKPEPEPRKKYKGHVYVIQRDGCYKIGRTKHLEKRLKDLSALFPTPLDLICAIPSDDLIIDEKSAHARFDSKRIKGEWFDLTAEDIAWLKQQEEK